MAHRERWQKVPGSEASGANGIEISKDGRWYYVAAWGSQSFFRLSRGGATPVRNEIPLGFRVDNIHWGRNGKLLATGRAWARPWSWRSTRRG
jgi:sugar lactone lactonase YvrE